MYVQNTDKHSRASTVIHHRTKKKKNSRILFAGNKCLKRICFCLRNKNYNNFLDKQSNRRILPMFLSRFVVIFKVESLLGATGYFDFLSIVAVILVQLHASTYLRTYASSNILNAITKNCSFSIIFM